MLQINCDLGEGIAWEEQLIPCIDTASVACGGHFGDDTSIQKTLDYCLHFDKKAGAHPSYPDRENFGRKSLKIENEALLASIFDQIERFEHLRKTMGMDLDHIKFHGALYNDAAKSPELADLLVDFLFDHYPQACLFVPPESAIEQAAANKGLPIKREIFGDRAYGDDYKLRPRSEEDSLFTALEQVEKQIKTIFERSSILATNGNLIPINADTICFHGDNQAVLSILPQIRKKWWS